MKPVSDFFSRITPLVLGCPEPTLQQAVVDASIAFCSDSLVLREHLDVFQTVAGLGEYDLDAPSQQDVARVLNVAVDGRAVQLVPTERASFPLATTGKPTAAFTRRIGSEFLLHLHATPDAVYPVSVEVATKPKRGATQLEDDLYDLWIEAVVAGALARICAIPGQPYTDPVVSANNSVAFRAHTNRARIEGAYGRVRGQIRVTARPIV